MIKSQIMILRPMWPVADCVVIGQRGNTISGPKYLNSDPIIVLLEIINK